jgi:hypothetical protein
VEEGRTLAEAVEGHVLLCFHSQDPQVSLEPVALSPIAEIEEAVQAGVQDTVKLVAARFECQTENV